MVKISISWFDSWFSMLFYSMISPEAILELLKSTVFLEGGCIPPGFPSEYVLVADQPKIISYGLAAVN